MKKISIYNTFGDYCINGSKAKRFADEQIVPHLKKGDKVLIDFTKVEMASSSFVNAIIFNTYGYGIFENQITFKAPDEMVDSMIKSAISNLDAEMY